MKPKPFKLLTLYLRREPTTDLILAGTPIVTRFDVAAYVSRDTKNIVPKTRWRWDMASKPTRRNKRVRVNCFQWAVVWLPDLTS